MREAEQHRARQRAYVATYDDEHGQPCAIAGPSRWATPEDVRRYRRAVVLADRYRRGISVGQGWRNALTDC